MLKNTNKKLRQTILDKRTKTKDIRQKKLKLNTLDKRQKKFKINHNTIERKYY